MNLNGTGYYYVRNAQGDITGLIDNAGNLVVSYTYDTWGKLIATTGSLASTLGVKNPYRYRGYRYDTETGLYYLQSRYYNPEWGRFVNADGITGVEGELLTHNMFAYCGNNAVVRFDPTGENYVGTMNWAISFAAVSAISDGILFLGDAVGAVVVLGAAIYVGARLVVDNWGRVRNVRASVWDSANKSAIKISNSFSKVTKRSNYRTPRQLHHIVAQTAGAARIAQGILIKVGIDRFTNPANLISLKTGLHSRLHNPEYYEFVDKIISSAFHLGKTVAQQRNMVYGALGAIRAWLYALDAASPF